MRVKEERIVITFHTTTEAMAAETTFRMQELPGRLIPVPRQISAGCGLAWSAPITEEGALTQCMEESLLKWDKMGRYWI